MKAIQIHQFGGPEVLHYDELPIPQLNAGEILVKTLAVGVNPIDWKTCSGGGASAFIGELPFIPGWEFSGTVEQAGDSQFAVGDTVFGMIRFPERAGCYAQYIAAPAAQVAKLPAAVDPVLAGGLATASLTAWQALFDKGGLQAGQQVLVLGGAGGVGHLAVQLAKWAGAHVTATASLHNHEFLASLGVEHLVDYQQQDTAAVVQNMDLIIDCVGGDTGSAALHCLKADGRMVTLPSVTKDAIIAAGAALGLEVLPIRCEANAAQLTKIAALVADQTLRLRLAGSYPISEVAEAFHLSAAGHVCGKLVLTFNESP